MSNIRYIKRADLDVKKWDACIGAAANGLIYAYTFYLDAMCDNWDALVLKDYEAVMPLPWRKKYSITYVYQPYFVNALGVFSANANLLNIKLFIDSIPNKFRYWDMDFNEKNSLPNDARNGNKFKIKIRNNYHLALNHPYGALHNNYRRLAKRKLAKAGASGLTIIKNADPRKIIYDYAAHYAEKHADLPRQAYSKLLNFCNKYPEHVRTYLASFPNGETAAFYLLLEDDRYLYSLLGGSTESGKEDAAFYLLTDAAIKDGANTGKIFRFEGSDIPGIAFFNQQFGSSLQTYSYLNYNGLPWPFNWLKK